MLRTELTFNQLRIQMLRLQYSGINQAWFFIWNDAVIKTASTKESMADYLKTETTLNMGTIAKLLDGEVIFGGAE